MKIFYTKRNDLSYTVKYLEQGTNKELASEKVVTNQTFQDTITENAIDIDGYDKVNRQENITITTGTNEIIFYYTKRTDLNYRVEYYFDEEIDNSLTETITATYLDVIENYTDKVKPGYKYESDTAPITIGTAENVIKVYYVTDENQAKELKYTVEYYKDGEKVGDDISKQIREKFIEVMDDDFNTADAIGYLFEITKEINLAMSNETCSYDYIFSSSRIFFELVTLLGFEVIKDDNIDEAFIEKLINERTEAKKVKDYKKADEIREKLKDMGITIQDTSQGVKWKKA